MAWKLEIHHIDVGRGDSTLIIVQKDEGKNNSWVTKGAFLLDSGLATAGPQIATYLLQTQSMPKELNYLILSHDHNDHYGGFQSGWIGSYLGKDTIKAGNNDICKSYKKEGFVCLKKGDTVFDFGPGAPKMTCIANPSAGKDINLRSLCFLIQYDKFHYYTGGDMEGDDEGTIANDISANYIFFKVGHHGSNRSALDKFLLKLKPRVAFISCGNDDWTEKHGHPTMECLKRLQNCKYIQNMFLTSCLPGRTGIVEDNLFKKQCGKAIVAGLSDKNGFIVRNGDIKLTVHKYDNGQQEAYIEYFEMYKNTRNVIQYRNTCVKYKL